MNDSEHDDPGISDNLRRIVPDDLSPQNLVDGARRKRRRRNGVVGVAAALALVAVAVPVTLTPSTEDSLIAEPAATPSVLPEEERGRASPLPGADACYTDVGGPIGHQQDTSGAAEQVAVRAWLCGDYDPETGQGVVGPVEPLTSGIDDLVQSVQSQPEVDLAVITCPADYQLTYNVVLEYDDGTRHIVGGERRGCQLTYDGGVVREGGEELYNDLIDAWTVQREADTETEVGDWGGPDLCPGLPTMIPMEVAETVAGRICVEEVDDGGTTHSMAYLDELVDEVVASMQDQWESPGRNTPHPTVPGTEQPFWLTLSNRYTDSLTFVRHEDGAYRTGEGAADARVWIPPQDLSVRLQEILEQGDGAAVPPLGVPLKSGPPPDVTPPWAAAGCQAVSEPASSDVPNGELPQGAVRVWMCPGDDFSGLATPMEPLAQADLAARATEAFNDLPPMRGGIPCTDDLGPTYRIVHEYADGTHHVVEYQHYGCGPASTGEVTKEGGRYFQQLVEMWNSQRGDEIISQDRPAPHCQLYSSVLEVDPRDALFTSGTACIDTDEASGDAHAGTPIPAGLLRRIVVGMETESEISAVNVASDGSIVLLTAEGDPFRIERLDDGKLYWWETEAEWVWTPVGETAEELAALFER